MTFRAVGTASIRYKRLREAVSILASPAEVQIDWLDQLFSSLTKGETAEAYGNDELALTFEDAFSPAQFMIENGEMSRQEFEKLRSLDVLLELYSGETQKEFWRREALQEDPRWEIIRLRAQEVLEGMPEDARTYRP